MNGIIISLEKLELQKLISDAVQAGIQQFEFSRKEEDENKKNHFLKAAEAADYLQISLSKIRYLTMLRKIPHIKQGRAVFYLKSDLDQWLLEQRQGSIKDENESRDIRLSTFKKTHKKIKAYEE